MDERDLDVIGDRLPKTTSALLISDEGEVSILLPKMKEDATVSGGLMAITELMMRLIEDPTMIEELADAFEKRTRL